MPIVTANTPHKVITIAMGIAVPSCKTPTSDAAPAATLNCKKPSIAEALPARAPCPFMAHAEALGMMQPRLAMVITLCGVLAVTIGMATRRVYQARIAAEETV